MIINNPNKTSEQIIREYYERERQKKAAGINPNSGSGATNPSDIPKAVSLDDYILLKDINCIDADNNIFESYPELYVRKEIFKNDKKEIIFLTPYNAIVNCEHHELFLPSFALTCNILTALYQRKSDAEINAVLMQYKDKGNGNGWHAQNTIINYASEEIIHYPSAADFNETIVINVAQQRIAKSFSKSILCDRTLEEALKIPDFAKYAKNLTGLQDPSLLVEIGNYFKKSAKVWFPWSGQEGKNYNEKRACWLGCYLGYFDLSSYGNLSSNDASRGVRKNFP